MATTVLWSILAATLVAIDITSAMKLEYQKCTPDRNSSETVYSFWVEDLHDKNISLSEFKGKVLLIVNLATYCDSTAQYNGYNALQTEFGPDNFTVLGFPCNQFGMQEPAVNTTELLNGLKHVRPGGGFEPNFKMFWKINVNGPEEHELFTYLKSACPPTRDYFAKKERIFYDNIKQNDIRWNFEKFLIDQDGIPVKRFDASLNPAVIRNSIATLLGV